MSHSSNHCNKMYRNVKTLGFGGFFWSKKIISVKQWLETGENADKVFLLETKRILLPQYENIKQVSVCILNIQFSSIAVLLLKILEKNSVIYSFRGGPTCPISMKDISSHHLSLCPDKWGQMLSCFPQLTAWNTQKNIFLKKT